MKKYIAILTLCLFGLDAFSQASSNQLTNDLNSLFSVEFIVISLFLLSLIVIQNILFRRKFNKLKTENQLKISETIKSCDEKISKSEAEMLKTLNVSITEIHNDYMNKIIQIRSDIEAHRTKIFLLMENNKEMKEFYDEMIKDHFNPILQNLN